MLGSLEVTVDHERQLTFLGFLTFLDPPKAGVDRVVAELAAGGIGLRMITGDNRLAAAHVARAVGLDTGGMLTGPEIDQLTDQQLSAAAHSVQVFAEVDPLHKERIIQALRGGGAVVGYLGDGINDAGVLHLADVGISVDTAVDVAKSAAAIVLLDKDLGVLVEGVRLGRQTFANTLKYVFTTVSVNFGNMASMAAASAFLPVATSVGVAAVTISLPYLPWLAEPLALVPLPATVLAALAAITLAYVAAAEAGKRLFYRAIDRPRPSASGRPAPTPAPARCPGARWHTRLAVARWHAACQA